MLLHPTIRLPIDSHGLLALIAPRHMLAATAWTDGCEPTWAVERSYKAGREVYRMLGVPTHLRIKYRYCCCFCMAPL